MTETTLYTIRGWITNYSALCVHQSIRGVTHREALYTMLRWAAKKPLEHGAVIWKVCGGYLKRNALAGQVQFFSDAYICSTCSNIKSVYYMYTHGGRNSSFLSPCYNPEKLNKNTLIGFRNRYSAFCLTEKARLLLWMNECLLMQFPFSF